MGRDYTSIRRDNERRYGTDIGRIGRMLLAHRYDDRTHFIFELLQNAEDALARQNGWQGSRGVSFHLSKRALRVSHFGVPFDERDVRGICGIAESTKDLTAIGRFGIGFKSVYAYTDRPEVHSGGEDFAIESFVWPVAAPAIERHLDETVILIPLKESDKSANDEIAHGLEGLGAFALLFLQQIEEIRWVVDNGRAGLYLRESLALTEGVRRVTVIGQEQAQREVFGEWLVFSRPVVTGDGPPAGHVELAFFLAKDEQSNRESIQRIEGSPLVVFFPTVLETHLGFLAQGPYRTTPSRDNVPRGDAWNQQLVKETASLLREVLRWLRDRDLLDTAALRCLPLDPAKFGEASMFRPLYEATKAALTSESLLPRFDSGHVSAKCARLGRTQELRDLLTPAQLTALYSKQEELVWLSGDITDDRTPELRRYLMQELNVPELTPEVVILRLDRQFLEAQPDAWIVSLYEFLAGQPSLRRRFGNLPLVRLEDGTHVAPHADGQPQVFLPGPIATGFPLVRATVCATEAAVEFLQSLGLTEPDAVDDVVRNVLPKYRAEAVDVNDAEYEADIGRILNAFGTNLMDQREKLVSALRETPFVKAVDAGARSKGLFKPGDVYLATERLKALFASVDSVALVDDGCRCLKGEDIRELLEACGGTRYLQPIPALCPLSWEQKTEIRRSAGLERFTWERQIPDVTLHGLEALLARLPDMDQDERRERANLLWDALGELESRRGSRTFTVDYTWGYSHMTKSATLDAVFVRLLNERSWVPDEDGNLSRPDSVLFGTLGWKPNPFLESKIHFKPPVIEQLAREAGIEPGVLDLLKKLGVTSEAELRVRLGVTDEITASDEAEGGVEDAINALLGDAPGPTPPVSDPTGSDPVRTASGGRSDSRGGGGAPGGGHASAAGGEGAAGATSGGALGTKSTAGSGGGRPFISYVSVHSDEDEPDPDGLDQQARLALEEDAIALILSREPAWQRTPAHNPGFDLFQNGPDGKPIHWCEVKAMSGSLDDRPVGLSRAQFDCAREHREHYWLYVVERANTSGARRVRIQDPAGKARTFTFDRGWLEVAEIDPESEERED